MRPSFALAKQQRDKIVLGTITRLSGPSPRPVGSQMIFHADKAVGYFSGGCLEADVANHARTVLKSGQALTLLYGKGSPWLDIRLLCGGTIEILLECIEPDDPAVTELLRLGAARRRAWWRSDGNARQTLEYRATSPDSYVVRHDPEWRVVIAGGDPVAIATARLAQQAGFRTVLIRPNGPDPSPVIAGIGYSRREPFDAIEELRPDRWTAVVAANHDDELDDAVILAALSGEAAYVGVLGSRARSGARRERLHAIGVAEEMIDALRSPIGAVRSGKAPWDVAVSIIAEIMEMKAEAETTC